MSGTKLFSIITVVKDDPAGFATSLNSLEEQTTHNFELVVIDSSKDPAVINQQLKESGLHKEIPRQYQWCAPDGIYPAMNHGLDNATGRFTYFLNAGDRLHAPDVLKKVEHKLGNRNSTWVFGPVEITDHVSNNSTTTPQWDYQKEKKNFFARGLFPPHQGTFASTQLLRDLGGFDPKYSISADYALFLKLSQITDPEEVDFPIANFVTGGVSTHKWRESFEQFHRARIEILKPQRASQMREQLWTRWHFVKVWTYRELIARVHR
jgi:glycosyltransferase involved in cell wall biosynthesis